MASQIAICNRALDLAAVDPIISLDDNSLSANLCKRNWPFALDFVLRLYPWNCAMARATLPAIAQSPDWGFSHRYALPAGPNPPYCLRVLEIDGELLAKIDYRIERREILIDDSGPLNILYIGRVTDPETLDPLLAEVVAHRLAYLLVARASESAARTQTAMAAYEAALSAAKRADAREGTPGVLVANDWLEARL